MNTYTIDNLRKEYTEKNPDIHFIKIDVQTVRGHQFIPFWFPRKKSDTEMRLIRENEDEELKKWKQYINSASDVILQEWNSFKKSISGYDPKYRILQDINLQLNPPEKWIPLHNQYPLYYEFSQTESYYFWCAEWLIKQKSLYEIKLKEWNDAEQKRREQENIKIEKINTEKMIFIKSKKESFLKKINGFIISEEELDAILEKYSTNDEFVRRQNFIGGKLFTKNILLSVKVLNRFAEEHKIRVEDADAVLKDYYKA